MSSASSKKNKRSRTLIAAFVLLGLLVVLVVTLAMFASFDEVTNRFEAGKVDIVLTETKWDPKNGQAIVPNTTVDKNPTIVNKEDTVNTFVFLKVTVPYDDDPALKVEYAYQDNTANAGNEVFSNSTSNPAAKVPLYKFVATGEKSDGTSGTVPSVTRNTDIASSDQAINSGWKLVTGNGFDNPSYDDVKKTITYIYAHVNSEGQLQELLPKATVEYPLFNQIYLQNFRERTANSVANPTVTAFPDPTRDYNIYLDAYGIQANFLRANNATTHDPYEVWQMITATS